MKNNFRIKAPKVLILISWLINTTSLVAQIKQELKLDLPGIFSNNYLPHYEAVLSNRVGVEIGVGFDFSDIYLREIDFTNFITIERHGFSATQLNPSIAGKYYLLFNKKYGNGLFIGPYVQWNYLLKRGDGYVEKWEEIRDQPATERVVTDRGIKGIDYGVHGGYKWIIKDHILIEMVRR